MIYGKYIIHFSLLSSDQIIKNSYDQEGTYQAVKGDEYRSRKIGKYIHLFQWSLLYQFVILQLTSLFLTCCRHALKQGCQTQVLGAGSGPWGA